MNCIVGLAFVGGLARSSACLGYQVRGAFHSRRSEFFGLGAAKISLFRKFSLKCE